jgi:membrane associated rhomboid family serine protease
MRLRTLAWAFIAIAVYTVFTRGHNAGGEAAHLGGAIVGFLLMQGEKVMRRGAERRGYFDR